MRVGIDYLPAVTHAPGVGRYARELVRALVSLPQAVEVPELRLLQAGGAKPTIGEPALGLAGAPRKPRTYRVRSPRRWLAAAHRLTGRGADRWLGGVDLFHRMLPGWPPVSHAPELLPIAELPPAGSDGEIELRAAIERAAGLLTFSTSTAGRLRERFDTGETGIHQVPVGCDHWSREFDGFPERDDKPPTVLVLGGIRKQRHHVEIVRAFDRLWRKELAGRLFLMGGPGDASDELEAAMQAAESRDQIRWVPRPQEGQLPALVARSACLVHLSEGEETPVTPLEAFSFGTPVVANRLPAFEEALGGEAHWVESLESAGDAKELAGVIEEAVTSAWDEAAVGRRIGVAAEFSWAKHAEATVGVWERMVLGG